MLFSHPKPKLKVKLKPLTTVSDCSEISSESQSEVASVSEVPKIKSAITQREWFNHYRTNPWAMSYEDIVTYVESSEDLALATKQLLLSAVHKLQYTKKEDLDKLLTRQEEIALNHYLHGFRNDTVEQSRYISKVASSLVKTLSDEYQPSKNAYPLIADIVVMCYELADMIGLNLDGEVKDHIVQSAMTKCPTDLEEYHG